MSSPIAKPTTTTTTPVQPPTNYVSGRRSNKTLPIVNFVQSLSYNLILFSIAAMLFSIPALYTSLIASAGGMSVDSLTAAASGKDVITHTIKIFEGSIPPKLVTKHETHLKFDSSSHDYANEKFRTIFPTSIPFGYFIYSVLKSMIDSNYSVFMGLHKMFYKLPESMTFVLAMIFVPLLYL
jgi:hypothetical protein